MSVADGHGHRPLACPCVYYTSHRIHHACFTCLLSEKRWKGERKDGSVSHTLNTIASLLSLSVPSSSDTIAHIHYFFQPTLHPPPHRTSIPLPLAPPNPPFPALPPLPTLSSLPTPAPAAPPPTAAGTAAPPLRPPPLPPLPPSSSFQPMPSCKT